MTAYLDKLNLRPMERRLVIGTIIIVFIFLNGWFVWPQFKEWNKVEADFAKATETLGKYRAKITHQKELENERNKLVDEGAPPVVQEEMALQLRKNVQAQVNQSGVQQNGISDMPRQTRSESFFDEASINMKFINTGEQELVDFLYNISAGRSMIRVKDLTVSPDQALQRLQGDVTLTASYQKKAPPKLGTPAVPGANPAGAAGKSNAAPAQAGAPVKAPPAKTTTPPPTQKKPLPKSADVER